VSSPWRAKKKEEIMAKAKKANTALHTIEKNNPALKGALPEKHKKV